MSKSLGSKLFQPPRSLRGSQKQWRPRAGRRPVEEWCLLGLETEASEGLGMSGGKCALHWSLFFIKYSVVH